MTVNKIHMYSFKQSQLEPSSECNPTITHLGALLASPGSSMVDKITNANMHSSLPIIEPDTIFVTDHCQQKFSEPFFSLSLNFPPWTK